MNKRTISIAVSGLLLVAFAFQSGGAQTLKELQAIEKVRASVLKLGVGPTARVEVKLKDQTSIKGHISEAGQDSFKVIDQETGASQTLLYADVAGVKKPGSGLSTQTWLIIGGAAAAAVVVGILVKPAVCDGGAQTRFPC